MTHGFIISKKGFYVGDICYAMPNRLYHEFWGDELGFASGVHLVPKNEILPSGAGFFFAVDNTAWGDGCLRDNSRREYDVDAGVIGMLPLELVDTDRYYGGGHIFEIPGVAEFLCEDGKFTIILPKPSEELIIIDTN